MPGAQRNGRGAPVTLWKKARAQPRRTAALSSCAVGKHLPSTGCGQDKNIMPL